MTEKDNLMYLIEEAEELFPTQVEAIADHLIANGVTVQRWIPVTDRLPTAEDALKGHVYAFLKDTKSGGEWPYEAVRNHPDWFSHWMPLPPAPKEVE